MACFAVKKELSSLVNNKTPTRRLLVAHASLDINTMLPLLYLVEKPHSMVSSSCSGGGGRCGNGNNSGGPNLWTASEWAFGSLMGGEQGIHCDIFLDNCLAI